ncbi:hypothetical protein RHSIM_Rhsim02G0031700 [Rhododendron simsii]|uniref:Uncharacterized protein n=1 Tax=Rhododendron simsii TaxID=118357 RepID=A0A834HAW6_RHOSS|nr:hypothetical protein RHSIM_Rhsim02G0031700 [Rhododendron simsii]
MAIHNFIRRNNFPNIPFGFYDRRPNFLPSGVETTAPNGNHGSRLQRDDRDMDAVRAFVRDFIMENNICRGIKASEFKFMFLSTVVAKYYHYLGCEASLFDFYQSAIQNDFKILAPYWQTMAITCGAVYFFVWLKESKERKERQVKALEEITTAMEEIATATERGERTDDVSIVFCAFGVSSVSIAFLCDCLD